MASYTASYTRVHNSNLKCITLSGRRPRVSWSCHCKPGYIRSCISLSSIWTAAFSSCWGYRTMLFQRQTSTLQCNHWGLVWRRFCISLNRILTAGAFCVERGPTVNEELWLSISVIGNRATSVMPSSCWLRSNSASILNPTTTRQLLMICTQTASKKVSQQTSDELAA